MTKTLHERLHRIIACVAEIAKEEALTLRDSAWISQEVAARLAERTACHDIPGGEHRSAEWLDAWTAACEACAFAIRSYAPIRWASRGQKE